MAASRIKTGIVDELRVAALAGCVCWAAVAPGMQALIPTFIAICAGVRLLDRKSDYIRYY